MQTGSWRYLSFMSEKEKLWIKSTYRVVGPRVKTQNDVVEPKMWPPNKHRSSKMRSFPNLSLLEDTGSLAAVQ